MTNTHDIVIPRSELPSTYILNRINGGPFVIVDGSDLRVCIGKTAAAKARKIAAEHIAAAEAIEKILADEARIEDEKKLLEEALVLHNVLHDQKSEEWSSGDSYAKKYWRNVAKAARELHAK